MIMSQPAPLQGLADAASPTPGQPVSRRVDVLVVGAGPAGLAAAHAAASAGAKVAIVDDNALEGGQIWRGGARQQKDARARKLWLALQQAGNVEFLPQSRVLYPLGAGKLLVQTPQQACVIAYTNLILTTGARELLLPFPGWTLPGVTGAGALQALAKGGYPVAGKRVVVAGSGPLLLAAAATLRQRGAHIVAIVEQAPPARLRRFAAGLLATPAKILQALQLGLQLRGTPYLSGSYVSAAHGEQQVASVTLQHAGGSRELACDYLACGYGLLPNLELAQAFGCRTGDGSVLIDAWQQTSVAGIYCAGEGTGVGGVDLALAEGRIAGLCAVSRHELAQTHLQARARWQRFAALLASAFALRPELLTLAAADTIVCRCEDVAHGELQGHASWRSAKLQTRCGMGPCQGRICGAATDMLYGWKPASVRLPIAPARVGSMLEF